MADGCLLNGHLRPNKYFCKMSTSPDLAEQLFAAFPLSGRSVGIVMCFWGSSVDQKFGTNTVCHLDIYNVLSGNGRSAGGVVRVRGSSVRPRRDQPLCRPRAGQAQIPCTGEITKRTLQTIEGKSRRTTNVIFSQANDLFPF